MVPDLSQSSLYSTYIEKFVENIYILSLLPATFNNKYIRSFIDSRINTELYIHRNPINKHSSNFPLLIVQN